jgi:hypothetical protein
LVTGTFPFHKGGISIRPTFVLKGLLATSVQAIVVVPAPVCLAPNVEVAEPLMDTNESVTTLNLFAGYAASGNSVKEEVLVERISPREYRILRSPGLIQGVAAGDVILAADDGTFKVLSRGQNLSIQMFYAGDIEALEKFTMSRLTPLGGRLDGKDSKLLVYTVPVSAGFQAVEKVLNEAVTSYPGAEWYYGNVYDPKDGVTPLNWWRQ